MAQEQNSTLALDVVDDFYFSALFDDDENDTVPISDDKYSQELQLQEILMSSLIINIKALPSISTPSPSKVVETPLTEQIELVIEQTGDCSSSSSSLIICEICAESKDIDQMFRNGRCDHSFCYECVTRQVATKLQESITIIACPGLNCKGMLELDACRPILPKDLLDRWNDALCEAHFLTVPKFYCPFRDCSAMMLFDDEEVRESECPFCHRLFCARCYVPWHPGVGCEEFQTLNEYESGREDLLVRELVNENKWSRCPQCKFYVEKTEGCLHITCRCQFEFCYACGEHWTSTHGGCQRN